MRINIMPIKVITISNLHFSWMQYEVSATFLNFLTKAFVLRISQFLWECDQRLLFYKRMFSNKKHMFWAQEWYAIKASFFFTRLEVTPRCATVSSIIFS